jgi:hypothetical protein
MKYSLVGAALAASLALAGCGSSGSVSPLPVASGPALLATIPVPGISSAVSFAFDLGQVDAAANRYYVTDRTNQSVDVVDTTAGTLIHQYKNGFTGCKTAPNGNLDPTCLAVNGVGVNNDASGPDGLDVVGTNIFVGDVNALWVIDKVSGTTVQKIAIGGASGLRADEGCFDADDGIYAISSPGESPPIMTFVNTKVTPMLVIATVQMHSAGLEACAYDTTTKKFFVNNDGQADLFGIAVVGNPRGELVGIAAADIVALKPFSAAILGASRTDYAGGAMVAAGPQPVSGNAAGAVATADPAGLTYLPTAPVRYALGNCDPTGLALGPGTDIGVMCRQGNVGEQLTFQILNRTTGAAAMPPLNAGGGDQIAFDAVSSRWFLSDSRWTTAGTSCAGGSAACPLSPVLAIVDGTSRALVTKLANGNNSHSVAVLPGVGGAAGKVFTPFTAPSAAGGGAGFPNGGINVFSTN